jgi:membrane-associated phospholipid phosphatase
MNNRPRASSTATPSSIRRRAARCASVTSKRAVAVARNSIGLLVAALVSSASLQTSAQAAAAEPAAAQPVVQAQLDRGPGGPRGPDRGMRLHLPWDVAITAGAFATWCTLELLTPKLVEDCRWCDRDANGRDTLNGFDAGLRDALRWNDTSKADTWSTVFSFGLAPAAGIGLAALVTAHDGRLDELPEGILIVAESAFITMSVNQLVKIVAARERPEVHARAPEERASLRNRADNVSFYSGHTTLAFALASAAGTIGWMRGYRLAPVMWATGFVLASIGGYLRIAADRHYASDVLIGAVVGSAIGFSVPYFFHQPRSAASSLRLSAVPAQRGASLALSGSF